MPVVHNGRRLLDGGLHLPIAIAKPLLEQRCERSLVELDSANRLDRLPPFLRDVELGPQQAQGFLAQLKTQIARVLKDFQHRQAIFVWPGEVGGVERIANDVCVPKLAVDSCRSVVGLLIRRRGEARVDDVVELLRKRVGRLRQDVRDAARRNLNVEVLLLTRCLRRCFSEE